MILKCACSYLNTSECDSFAMCVTRQYMYVNITHYTDLWFEDHTLIRTYSINELGNWIRVNISIDTAAK